MRVFVSDIKRYQRDTLEVFCVHIVVDTYQKFAVSLEEEEEAIPGFILGLINFILQGPLSFDIDRCNSAQSQKMHRVRQTGVRKLRTSDQ